MKKSTLLIFAISFLFILTPGFSSNDGGFIIRNDNFLLTLRFTLNESFEDRESQFLSIPESIFYQTINWYYINNENLCDLDLSITIYVNPQKNEFTIWEGTGEYVSYTNEEDFFAQLIYQINHQFHLETSFPKTYGNVPIYRLSSKEYIEDISSKSDLFMGSLPSYMYDYERREYFLVFWEIESSKDFLEKNKNRAFSLEFIYLNIGNIGHFFHTIF